MTTVVNLFGGPGIGKSTTAARLFAELKDSGVNAELVQEYVKGWAWEGRSAPTHLDQLYLTAKQARREQLLYGKVDVIVTDSPLLLGPFYCSKMEGPNYIKNLVWEWLAQTQGMGVRRENFFLIRTKPFNPKGRFHSEEESIKIDEELATFLHSEGVKFKYVKDADSILRGGLL